MSMTSTPINERRTRLFNNVEDFSWVMKASGVLGSPQIAVESDGSKVTVLAFDSSDSSAHTDALEVADMNKLIKLIKLILMKLKQNCNNVPNGKFLLKKLEN